MIPTMTKLGDLNSTDKVGHGYTYLYDDIFVTMRYSNVRILEIGFARGRGAKLLAEYFHRGTIHTFDIEPNWNFYKEFPKVLQKRIHLYQGDQSDSDSINEVLKAVANGPKNEAKRGPRKFDIVIDDGSHKPNDQQTSFSVLWSHVKDGGLYIIEDFHPYYNNSQHSTVSWLFDKIHQLNRFGDKYAEPTLKDMSWIMFSYNQVVLRKT